MIRWRTSWALIFLVLGALFMSGAAVEASYYPIFTAPFNGSKTKDFSLVKDGDRWTIVAINDPVPWPPLDQPENAGLPVSTSYDLEHWTFQGVAIPVGATGSWDDRAAWAPSIIKSGDTWYLYYAGVHVQNGTLVQKIGLATSTDTIHWTKEPTNPVFDCSSLSWVYWDLNDTANGAACRDPFVIRDEPNNRWVMFFTAALPHDINFPYWSIANPAVIGVATSTDLIHWEDAGNIPATRGFTAESPHVFEHAGTWYLIYTNDCSFQGTTKCLIYSTAPTLTGPYSGYADVPAIENYFFASDYYQTVDGREIFGAIGAGTTRFYDVDWSGGGFNLQAIPSARISGHVWNDTNRDGQQDLDEAGINTVKVQAYLDNGDGIFSATDDHYLTYNATRTVGANGSGYFIIGFMQPGLTWLTVSPEHFTEAGVLTGLTSTNGGTVKSYTFTSSDPATDFSFGFAVPDTDPPAAVANLAGQ